VKLLHTADLHLTSRDNKRLEVLNWIVEKSNALNIDTVIIAGDLFDSDTDANQLRQKVREIFKKTSAEILIVPGNHDENSYSPGGEFGSNVHLLIEKPYQILVKDSIKIVAFPYQNIKFSEFKKDLPEDIDILIIHGTVLDPSFSYLLTDEDIEYLPIYPASLEDTARYVAFGHFHTRYLLVDYKKTKVCYPGAPVALSTKCTKERVVVYVEMDRENLKIEPLKIEISPFWRRLEYFVYPDIEETIFKKIQSDLEALKFGTMPYIIIRGFIATDEKAFYQKLNEIEKNFAPQFLELKVVAENITVWERILTNPIIKKFVERTKNLNDRLRMKIFEIVFPIFNDLIR